MALFEELQNLMIKHRFRANKKLGQHFVTKESLIEKLVELAELRKDDTVLEIGPGTGFLTRELAKKSKVIAVEIDEILCELLEEEYPKVEVICGDFLKAKLPKFNKLVSLPPYFHSAAIMYKLLEQKFELGILVFQKEFGEKLVAEPGFEEYSALSVLTQCCFEAKIIQNVSPDSFFPKPKDQSCILLLKENRSLKPVKYKKGFAFFVKTLFRFRNKNLKNALDNGKRFLLPTFELDEKAFLEKCKKLPFLENKVDLLEVQDFVEIFNTLKK